MVDVNGLETLGFVISGHVFALSDKLVVKMVPWNHQSDRNDEAAKDQDIERRVYQRLGNHPCRGQLNGRNLSVANRGYRGQITE
jgi:hypothetical protein